MRGAGGRKGNKWKAACQEGSERQQHREEPCLSFGQSHWLCFLCKTPRGHGSTRLKMLLYSARGSGAQYKRAAELWYKVQGPELCLVRLEAAESQERAAAGQQIVLGCQGSASSCCTAGQTENITCLGHLTCMLVDVKLQDFTNDKQQEMKKQKQHRRNALRETFQQNKCSHGVLILICTVVPSSEQK